MPGSCTKGEGVEALKLIAAGGNNWGRKEGRKGEREEGRKDLLPAE